MCKNFRLTGAVPGFSFASIKPQTLTEVYVIELVTECGNVGFGACCHPMVSLRNAKNL